MSSDFRNIRVAIVHDHLNEFGGGERVLLHLRSIFPQADIYTSSIDYKLLQASPIASLLPKILIPHNQWLFLRNWSRRINQLVAPLTWKKSIDFSKYDLVLSHGGFYLSHLVHLAKPKGESTISIHYAITPPKNFYYRSHQNILDVLLQFCYYPFLKRLEEKAFTQCDVILTVSDEVRDRFRTIYSTESLPPIRTVHPPVDVNKKLPKKNKKNKKNLPFAYVGRVAKEKNLEPLVQTFNILGWPLRIVGEGNDKLRLMQQAKSNILFQSAQYGKDLQKVFRNIRGFIHPAVQDDFPLTPIEALSYGVPLLALRSGGMAEMIKEGETGFFIADNTLESFLQAVKKFANYNWSAEKCFQEAQKYSLEVFRKKMLLEVKKELVRNEKN